MPDRTLRRPTRLWPALLALACSPRPATTAGDSDSDSPTSTTGTGTTLATDASAGTGEGTGAGGEVEASCVAVCGAYDTCAPELSGPSCVPDCVAGLAPPLAGPCVAAWVQFYGCLAALECPALLGEAPCPAEDAAITASCPEAEEPCTVEIYPTSAKRCSYQEVCPGEPTRGLDCANTTCTCITDGIEGATCPADGICLDTGELGTKMLTCCG